MKVLPDRGVVVRDRALPVLPYVGARDGGLLVYSESRSLIFSTSNSRLSNKC